MADIHIHKLRSHTKNGEFIVSARVAGDDVWFSSKDVELRAIPEAFLSAFLIAAQLQGDRLCSEKGVCRSWLDNAEKLLPVTADLWHLKAQTPFAPSGTRVTEWKGNRKTALFFTCGTDSFHTLLEHSPKPDALISVFGYDIALHNQARQDEATRSLQDVARSLGIPVIQIKTNLRQHPYFNKAKWGQTQGSAEAAVAHLLEPFYQDFTLSSSSRISEPQPTGSSCQTDYFLGSKIISFHKWGSDLSQAEKMERIADHPLVRQHLRVCWQSTEPASNCGRCAKCVAALVSLTWAGKFDLLKNRFQEIPSLPEAVAKWKLDPIQSPDELDAVYLRPERLPEPLRAAIISRRTSLLRTIHSQEVLQSFPRHQLLEDRVFKPLMNLSKDHQVYYHKVPGNVGDDLIHAAAHQLFQRFGITLTDRLEEADQVVMCGGGSIGIWEGCAKLREKIYAHCEARSIPVILHPQSVGGAGEKIPEIVRHRFVREWDSLPAMPGARLMPDLALGYRLDRNYGTPLFDRGIFLRKDLEGRFSNYPGNIGDPPHLVPRDLQDYFQLAASYRHLVTDRLHFAIAGLLLKRRVTLLPNHYHKNRSMWETWLKDLGCEWAESPELAFENISDTKPLPYLQPKSCRLGMVMCVHNEEKLIEINLRYHHAIGVDVAYLFLDRCTDRTEEIARKFPWVQIIHRDTPDDPHFFRTHQVACMDDALQLARIDGLDWLLGIDADEFAFANYAVEEGTLSEHNLELLPPPLRDSPQARRWLRANLKCLLVDVSPDIDQILLATREALPLRLPEASPFWRQEFFIADGEYPGEVLDPGTGTPRKLQQWLGHRLGKPIIRTSAEVQALNAHLWTKWQGARAPNFAWEFPLPTLRRGWHAHYLCIDPAIWLKKFQDVARHHEVWPNGSPVPFPKLEWSRAAKNWSVTDAEKYLREGVQISRITAEKWTRELKGVIHHPILGSMLDEVMAVTMDIA